MAPSGSGEIIRCEKCSARTVSDYRGKAAEEWNRRATSSSPADQKDVLQIEKGIDALRLMYGAMHTALATQEALK
jgi:hypothetical protein